MRESPQNEVAANDMANEFEPHLHLWPVLTNLPGVGVSLMDSKGGLLFVNQVAIEMFFVERDVDYAGKTIADFHSPAFVKERLALIAGVLEHRKPVRFRHIYKARRLESKIWPLSQVTGEQVPSTGQSDDDRVLVVTREFEPDHDLAMPAPHDDVSNRSNPMAATSEKAAPADGATPTEDATSDEEQIIESAYIDLGYLNTLTPRELEVLVLLGHGLSVPQVAKRLFRSTKTIERHKTSIGQKLQLCGQAAITRLVTQIGMEVSHANLKRLRESGRQD
ncbi:MAG: LuxR C-terminal-related transcriptional regulator [Planctomycetota bacterium]